MTNGIDITMQTLAQSKNGAANKLLEKALHSSLQAVCRIAGKYLVAQKGGKGILGIIRNFTPQDTLSIEIIDENREKFVSVLKTAIQGSDAGIAQNALKIVQTQQFYTLLSFLLLVFMEQEKGEKELNEIAETFGKLLDDFVNAMEEKKKQRFLYGTVFPDICSTLTKKLRSYRKNDPDLVLLAFFRLYPYMTEEHLQLVSILRNPAVNAYQTASHLLLTKEDSAVYDLIFYCLNNVNPPQMVSTAFSKRSDIAFISAFLKLLTGQVSDCLKTNLISVSKPEWLERLKETLEQLDEKAQQGLALLISLLNHSTAEILAAQQTLFQHGTGRGRLAALSALSHYSGERIDKLVWDACGDFDPKIQVAALHSLSKRKIPNMNIRLLQFAGSPDEEVREAVQKLLPNFRFTRFIASFDQMNEEQRRMMFKLVRAMDSDTADELAKMLTAGDSEDKNKALLCVHYGQMVSMLEEAVCSVLAGGESPSLRIQAAGLLTDGQREMSRGVLVQALHRDPDPDVRAAAKASLKKRPVLWKTVPEVSVNH